MIAPKLNSLLLPAAPSACRVVVAMSGGVDSSVVAAMLSREGYEVIGITLQLYDDGAARQRPGSCCAGQDVHDARRVADALNIPHYVLDYEQRFRSAVIDSFAASYVAGETPIPCVACNRSVKFTDLLETARELGADALATGHYIRMRARSGGGIDLLRARDPERDQSYFLYATTREQLELLRFPLGDLHKPQVRAIAHDLGLTVADKTDSQDICFVPSGRYTDVISKLRPDAATPGDIVDRQGNVLGRHQGIIGFTIGQRRGLGLSGTAEPLYVIDLDATRAQVIVGPHSALLTHDIALRDVNWLGATPLADAAASADSGLDVHVRIRSTTPPRPAVLLCDETGVRVRLADGEHGVSPGQACVFYSDGDEAAQVLGGGTIAGRIKAPLDVEAGTAAAEAGRDPLAIAQAEGVGANAQAQAVTPDDFIAG